MVTVRDITDVMERWAPLSLTEQWDNTGLMTGDPEQEVNEVIVALDVTESIVASAIGKNALVISHHPILFKPLKSLSGKTRVHTVIRQALAGNVPLYAAHTNLDRTSDGVSEALAHCLGIKCLRKLVSMPDGSVKFVVFVPPSHADKVREAAGNAGAGIIGQYTHCAFAVRGVGSFVPSRDAKPYAGASEEESSVEEDRIEMIVSLAFLPAVIEAVRSVHPYEEMAYDIIPLMNDNKQLGYGAVGELDHPMKSSDFIEFVSERLNVGLDMLPDAGLPEIRRVAVMGGSGGSFCQVALSAGADAYVTGEIGYHAMLDYSESLLLLDAGHRATEMPVLEVIADRIRKSKIGGRIDATVML